MEAKEYLKKNRKGCYRHDRDERMYYEKDVIKLMENYAKQLSIHVVVKPLKTNKGKCPCEIPFSQTWCDKHERWT